MNVQELIERVRTSKAFDEFPPATAKLFDFYAERFPSIPTADQIAKANIQNLSVQISRLNKCILKSFEKDHTLWRPQKLLHLDAKSGFEDLPLSTAGFLVPTKKFWFAQCVRLQNESGAQPSEPVSETLIVFSEPLFFFSKRLQGYFRFLDINHDGPISKDDAEKLARRAKTQLQRILPKDMKELNADLDLAPCRSYVPAGDAYAALTIRRWFTNAVSRDAAIQYKESSFVAPGDPYRTNMIVLASRSSLGLLHQFQTTIPELKLRLTGRGIKRDLIDLEPNDGPDDNGTLWAQVLVTNWTFSTGNVHTYIASNYARAVDRVAELLVNDNLLAPVCQAIIGKDRFIPSKFQIVFKVPLHHNETRAGDPKLLLTQIYPELEQLD